MFWLSFVCPRSHSGWTGPIGQFYASSFIPKRAWWYSIPPDLHSIWRNRLVFPMPFRTSTIAWLVFCMFWLGFLYPGPIPAAWGRLANLELMSLGDNQLTGTPSSLSPAWPAFNMKKKACFPYPLSYQYDRVTWFLYVLTAFCIPQVPFRLNWADWRNCCSSIYPVTSLPVPSLFPLTGIQY